MIANSATLAKQVSWSLWIIYEEYLLQIHGFVANYFVASYELCISSQSRRSLGKRSVAGRRRMAGEEGFPFDSTLRVSLRVNFSSLNLFDPPILLCRIAESMAGEEGFEPPYTCSRGRCLTAWRLPTAVDSMKYYSDSTEQSAILRRGLVDSVPILSLYHSKMILRNVPFLP